MPAARLLFDLLKVAGPYLPQVLNLVGERKNTREIADKRTQEALDDIYQKLKLAQQNDEALKNSINGLEQQIKLLLKWLIGVGLISLILLCVVLTRMIR